MELFTLVAVGIFAILWLTSQKGRREDFKLALGRLESAQNKLFVNIQGSMNGEKQIAIITAFSTILSQSLDVRQVIETAINMVVETMKVEVVLLFSLNGDTQNLELVAYEGIDKTYASTIGRMKLGEGFCGRVASTGQPLIVTDVSTDAEYGSKEARDENIKAQLSVPLQSRGKIIGTLCAGTRTPHQFSHDEIELLIAIGNLVGIAMENSQLYFEKTVAAEQCRLSEERYRRLFENAHDAIWVQDLSGKITAANKTAAEIFGCSLPELIGADIKDFVSEDGTKLSRRVQEELLRGKEIKQPYTQAITKKDGSKAILRMTTNLVSNNDHPDGMQFIARDRTKEVRMQENQSFFLQQITRAHEEERLRIARDLHDCTAQGLIAILHQMHEFSRAGEHLSVSDIKILWDLQEQLKDVLQDVRQLSRGLRPSILDDLGLLAAVEWLAGQLRAEHKIEASLLVTGTERRFSPDIEITLFRIIQEALRNITKHAQASKTEVVVAFQNSETKIAISDNGKGFEMPASLGELSRLGKLGIDGMQTRVRLIGGNFNVHSGEDRGTIITITIPA
ncbi:MAG: PAS domain S-box protein [Actinomycetota bacterium]|nr:PAS domain S-box protein [Actinomycetota bacterium]